MFDCADVPGDAGPADRPQPPGDTDGQPEASAVESSLDPRLSTEFTRCFPRDGEQGTVLLVGVVHDHPASLYRVSHLLSELSPDILALELPPLAMPLFEAYSRDDYDPPRMGGEMSVALQRAGDVRAVGIDAPNRAYVSRLVKRILSDRPSRSVLRRIGRDLVRGTGHALVTRAGASLAGLASIQPRLYVHLVHGVSLFDTASEQATNEQAHIAEMKTLLDIVEHPPWTQLIDTVREETMAEQITALRAEGDVFAVVGLEHLEPLAARLEDGESDGDV